MKKIIFLLSFFLSFAYLLAQAENFSEKNLWKTLYFDTASHLIDPNDKPVIKEIADYLKKTQSKKILLSGHADHVGGYKYNQSLSYKRVYTVKQALVQEGIEQSRIVIEWHGYTKPIIANAASETEKAKNRRVEIFKSLVIAPDYVQDFKIVFPENDQFDVIVNYECEKFVTFYGEWKEDNCVLKKTETAKPQEEVTPPGTEPKGTEEKK
jgi:hypothetical protein